MTELVPPRGEKGTSDDIPSSENAGEQQKGEAGNSPEHSEPWWRECLRDHAREAEPECVALIEVVYAIGDLHTRAQDMRLDFLSYLLGMAFQEAVEQLRANDPFRYPQPPTR